MERKLVKSSSIRSIGYDEETHTLELEFVQGDIYQYSNVPKYLHEALEESESIGSYFARHIKHKKEYPCTKMPA